MSYAGPDLGLLCAAGKVEASGVRVRVARHDPARAALPGRAPGRFDRGRALRRGNVPARAAGRGVAGAVPADPGRTRLRSVDAQRPAATVDSPYDDGETFVAAPALELDAALVHLNRADATGQRPVPRPRPVLRRPHPARGHGEPIHERRTDRADGGPHEGGVVPHAADQPADGRRGGRGTERRALHVVRARLRARRSLPAGVREVGVVAGGVGRVQGRVARPRRAELPGEGGRDR